jgi:hypothetical protein
MDEVALKWIRCMDRKGCEGYEGSSETDQTGGQRRGRARSGEVGYEAELVRWRKDIWGGGAGGHIGVSQNWACNICMDARDSLPCNQKIKFKATSISIQNKVSLT